MNPLIGDCFLRLPQLTCRYLSAIAKTQLLSTYLPTMPVAAENEPGTRSTWGQLWGQLQKIELRFAIEINRLQAQFNGARLHHLFHLPTPNRICNWSRIQLNLVFMSTAAAQVLDALPISGIR